MVFICLHKLHWLHYFNVYANKKCTVHLILFVVINTIFGEIISVCASSPFEPFQQVLTILQGQ